MPGPASIKTCFVTIGATASFSSLIEAVLNPNFLAALEAQKYTNLWIQYGKDGDQLYYSNVQKVQISHSPTNIQINGFDLDADGLQFHLLRAKGHNIPNAIPGVVISHAGSGTILDAMRISVPLIVVPNSTLLDDHQKELAEALAEQGYVVHGHLDDLASALQESDALREKSGKWPPINSGTHRQAKGLAGVLDEEMGFLD